MALSAASAAMWPCDATYFAAPLRYNVAFTVDWLISAEGKWETGEMSWVVAFVWWGRGGKDAVFPLILFSHREAEFMVDE